MKMKMKLKLVRVIFITSQLFAAASAGAYRCPTVDGEPVEIAGKIIMHLLDPLKF